MDIAVWLCGLGLDRYVEAFRANEITAEVLPELTDTDLRELGLPLGPRKVLLKAIREIAALPSETTPSERARAQAEPRGSSLPEAERRQLTLMFVDLVGSTELSRRLDPEDVRQVIRGYQNAIAGEVAHFDGHIAKFLGDGALVYFGWPKAYEDAAERAVRAGLAVVEAVAKLPRPDRAPLAARVGIATGLVVVGDLIGEGTAAREEAVVGETPNLAARLQALAAPGQVVVAEGTRRLLGQLFEIEELGEQRLKGFGEPVRAFRVVGQGTAEGRFEALHGAALTPLVGREHELGLLLDRWRLAKAGEGQVVLVSGEPGIGKSRIVLALRERLRDEPRLRLRYHGSPYHSQSALRPVLDQLERAAGLMRDEPAATKLDKLEALFGQAESDVVAVAPLFAELLAIPTGERYPPLELTPQQRKARILAALLAQFDGLARGRLVLMVLEDAHWFDPTTLELFDLVVERVQHLPVLLVVTFRPEFRPPWTDHAHVTSLTLNRLGRGQAAAIVERTAGKALPPEVLGAIVTRTDGVPLFLEELTKAVLEAGLLRDADGAYELSGPLPPLAIPATLQDSLMARLDRLAPVKEVAQVGAVLGREFSRELLAAITPMDAAHLDEVLEQLVAAGLIFRRGVPPDTLYVFKHALVQDVAYQSLLKSRRQQLHARVAELLQGRFPEVGETQPEVLAHHLTEAGLADRAVECWQRAGQRALARSAMAEAVAHLTRGLEVLADLPGGPERQRRELGLQLALGQASIAAKGFAAPETGRAYARARELCRELGDVPELFSALYGRFIVHFQRGELAVAHEAARELLRLAEERGDAAARVTGHRVVGSALHHLGRLAESRTHLEEGLALYEPERDRGSAFVYALDSRVVCLFWLVHVLFALGYPEQARARMREALAHARELAHPYTVAYALSVACILHGRHRPGREARTDADALIAFATEQGFPLPGAVGTVVGGWALTGEGPAEEGIARMRRGLADYTATGAELWVPDFLALLAQAHGRVGRPAAGLGLLAEALDRAERTGGRWLEAELHRLQGELLLALPEPDPCGAEGRLHQALAVAREQDARMWELRAATSLARLWREQGRRSSEACDLLAPIYGWFTEGFDAHDLREAKALLDELG